MRARETRAAGQFLAKERGSKDSEDWGEAPVIHMQRQRLIESLDPESLASVVSVSELIERAA